MENHVHYYTVTDAINKLREKGFILDFNIVGDNLVSQAEKIDSEDFEIVDIYRYEGDSDPGDEAVVYAIQSKQGLKGVLVTGYGASADAMSVKILEKLSKKVEGPSLFDDEGQAG